MNPVEPQKSPIGDNVRPTPARAKVEQMVKEHPEWSAQKIATECNCSSQWVQHITAVHLLGELAKIPTPAAVHAQAVARSAKERLSSLLVLVKQGQDVAEASDFARWLAGSKLPELIAAFESSDGREMRQRAEALVSACNEFIPPRVTPELTATMIALKNQEAVQTAFRLLLMVLQVVSLKAKLDALAAKREREQLCEMAAIAARTATDPKPRKGVSVFLAIYNDVVKAEVEEGGKRRVLGWFDGEASAVAAAVESVLWASSHWTQFRRLPPIQIVPLHMDELAKRKTQKFKPAIRSYYHELEESRHVVRTPGTFGKTWIRV